MKIEIDIEESVYKTWQFLLQALGITVEQYLINYLTQAAAIMATKPELITEATERVIGIEGMQQLFERISRKPGCEPEGGQ